MRRGGQRSGRCRLCAVLDRRGVEAGVQRVYRLYREEGLAVRRGESSWPV